MMKRSAKSSQIALTFSFCCCFCTTKAPRILYMLTVAIPALHPLPAGCPAAPAPVPGTPGARLLARRHFFAAGLSGAAIVWGTVFLSDRQQHSQSQSDWIVSPGTVRSCCLLLLAAVPAVAALLLRSYVFTAARGGPSTGFALPQTAVERRQGGRPNPAAFQLLSSALQCLLLPLSLTAAFGLQTGVYNLDDFLRELDMYWRYGADDAFLVAVFNILSSVAATVLIAFAAGRRHSLALTVGMMAAIPVVLIVSAAYQDALYLGESFHGMYVAVMVVAVIGLRFAQPLGKSPVRVLCQLRCELFYSVAF